MSIPTVSVQPSGVSHPPLHPNQWWPHGVPEVTSRIVLLRSGEQVRVVSAGADDGPPVLLLHGWGASAYTFRKLLGPLASAGARVVALDLRGHGLSDKPEGTRLYTAPALADFVDEVMAALDLTSATVVGNSMGGAVALDLCARAGHRVRALGLVAPAGLAPLNWIAFLRFLSPGVLGPARIPRWAVGIIVRAMYGRIGVPTERDVDEYWAPSQFPEFARALGQLAQHYDWSPRSAQFLAVLERPIRVILGTQDRLVDSDLAVRAAREIPSATVRVVDGAGHLLPEETPETVLAELTPLLAC